MNMKLKRLALVLAIVLMASTIAPVLAKSPFSDVSADHWAYDSIVELAAAGLVEGYPDGTFGGNNNLTRYEASMVFARALTRLENRLGSGDVLPALDQIKAEIIAELSGQGGVETTIVERVVVDGDNSDLEARVAGAERAAEAVAGDVAYLEARVLGLLDGIRYDVNKVQEQVEAGIEPAGLEEIEELIAAKVEAAIIEAALGTKETIIVNQMDNAAGLTEAEVEAIAENAMLDTFHNLQLELALLAQRVGKQEKKLNEHDAILNTLVSDVKELKKVTLGGSFKTTLENNTDDAPDTYLFKQTAGLDFNIKASDTTDVKASIGGKYNADDKDLTVTSYRLEVDSATPITKFIAGKLDGDADVAPRYNSYVFGGGYVLGGIADMDIVKGLTANILVAGEPDDAGDAANVDAALALTYKFIPALGIKLDAALSKAGDVAKPELDAFGVNVFGEVAGIGYGANFAQDRGEEEENTIFDVSANAKVSILTLDGKFVSAQDNYGINRPFVHNGSSSIEAGAGLEFLGIDLAGRYYRESGEEKLVDAVKVDASREFSLGLPVNVSAGYVWNKLESEEEAEQQFTAAASFAKKADLGLSYGAGVNYVKNAFAPDTGWKHGNFTDKDSATIKGNVGYALDWKTAIVSLGYDLAFFLPIGEENPDAKTLTHNLNLGYDFTKNVGLTAGSTIKQDLDAETRDISYKAGFSVAF